MHQDLVVLSEIGALITTVELSISSAFPIEVLLLIPLLSSCCHCLSYSEREEEEEEDRLSWSVLNFFHSSLIFLLLFDLFLACFRDIIH